MFVYVSKNGLQGYFSQAPARLHVKGVAVLQRFQPGLQPHAGSQRNHGAVVGAQMQLGVMHADAALPARRIELAAQQGIGVRLARRAGWAGWPRWAGWAGLAGLACRTRRGRLGMVCWRCHRAIVAHRRREWLTCAGWSARRGCPPSMSVSGWC